MDKEIDATKTLWRIGIDVGGTFTDICLIDENSGLVKTIKVASTPKDPSLAIETGVRQILAENQISPFSIKYFAHGTTVATNVAIQGNGAKTGLITTKGFRDLLEIGRQKRPHLFDLFADKSPCCIPRNLRLEIEERITSEGLISSPVNIAEVDKVLEKFQKEGIESLAICFLYSYLNSENEEKTLQRVKEMLPDVFCCTSSEVIPEFREYERFSTTALNAFVGPVIQEYFIKLKQRVKNVGIEVTPYINQSSGGVLPISEAARNSVRTMLSGPAAGVEGAKHIARQKNIKAIITLDMGGTSTDVSLIEEGKRNLSVDREISGYPVRVPMVDIATIGAGGGSYIWVDSGGALKVGPYSAGADPGPACYGRGGDRPTLTDAHVVIGTLNPHFLLGGKMPIYKEKSVAAIKKIADILNLTVEETALGAIKVAISNLIRSIKLVSVEKGHDPRRFDFMVFGGAGPLHGSWIMKEIGATRVIIPKIPGLLCGLGLLVAPVRQDYVHTCLMEAIAENQKPIKEIFNDLEQKAVTWMDGEDIPLQGRTIERWADMRYRYQNYELDVSVPWPELDIAEIIRRFHIEHEAAYGYTMKTEPVQLVNARVVAMASYSNVVEKPQPLIKTLPRLSFSEYRNIWFGGENPISTPVILRDKLKEGNYFKGPMIIEQQDTTVVVMPEQQAEVDQFGNIIITEDRI